ncbi:MAG: hypothetical protein V1824_03685 [archaeon]
MSLNNFNKIILDLTTSPNSRIDDISKRTNINKETIKRILLNLIKDGLVKEIEDKYLFFDKFISIRNKMSSDIYFNFNVLLEHKTQIYNLFYKIENYVYNHTGKKPSRTQMQKIAIEINNGLNLNLPSGWYKYGQILPIAYNPEIDYSKFIVTDCFKNIEADIYSIINKNIINSSVLNSKNITLKQYNSGTSNMHKFYALKEDFLKHIYDDNLVYVSDNFKNFVLYNMDFEDNTDVINRFYGFLISFNTIYKNKEKEERYRYKNLLVETYNTLCQIVSIDNYKRSIKEYYIKNNFNLEDIERNTSFELNIANEKFNELLSEFYEDFEVRDFFDKEDMKRFVDKVLSKKSLSNN